MAQLQKGTTYADTSPDNQVTFANLNALVDDAILLPGAITAQTPLTATAGGDRVLVADLSAADGLKAVTLANLLPPEVITGKTDLSTGLAAGAWAQTVGRATALTPAVRVDRLKSRRFILKSNQASRI